MSNAANTAPEPEKCEWAAWPFPPDDLLVDDLTMLVDTMATTTARLRARARIAQRLGMHDAVERMRMVWSSIPLDDLWVDHDV